ncbi:MAG: hypothetical protein QOJ60_1417, partial [Actinomycetota bacterium]|nr:hypothetical protein [Actinomycetota bacterium]
VLGRGGAGKSVFALALGKKVALPVVELGGAVVHRGRWLWGAADECQQLGLDVCVIGDVDARPVLAALA